MNNVESVDTYLVRDVLAILSIFVISLLGIGLVFNELKGSLTILVDKIRSKVKH